MSRSAAAGQGSRERKSRNRQIRKVSALLPFAIKAAYELRCNDTSLLPDLLRRRDPVQLSSGYAVSLSRLQQDSECGPRSPMAESNRPRVGEVKVQMAIWAVGVGLVKKYLDLCFTAG
jgi:hypothetical protein